MQVLLLTSRRVPTRTYPSCSRPLRKRYLAYILSNEYCHPLDMHQQLLQALAQAVTSALVCLSSEVICSCNFSHHTCSACFQQQQSSLKAIAPELQQMAAVTVCHNKSCKLQQRSCTNERSLLACGRGCLQPSWFTSRTVWCPSIGSMSCTLLLCPAG